MTGTDLCVNKSQFVPLIFEPPCISNLEKGPAIITQSIYTHYMVEESRILQSSALLRGVR
jgi:hypothetical protein